MGTTVWTVAFDGGRKAKPAQARIGQFVKGDNGHWYGVLKWNGHVEVVMAEHIFRSESDCLEFCAAHNSGMIPAQHEDTEPAVIDANFVER